MLAINVVPATLFLFGRHEIIGLPKNWKRHLTVQDSRGYVYTRHLTSAGLPHIDVHRTAVTCGNGYVTDMPCMVMMMQDLTGSNKQAASCVCNIGE